MEAPQKTQQEATDKPHVDKKKLEQSKKEKKKIAENGNIVRK